MSIWRIGAAELIEPGVRASIFSGMITPFHPIPESLDEGVDGGAVELASVELPSFRNPEEALRQCFLSQVEAQSEEAPYKVRLRAYYQAVASLDIAIELLVKERGRALTESKASLSMLWREVMMGALYSPFVGLMSGVKSIAAERMLIKEMGRQSYVTNLNERKTRSRAVQSTMERIWSLEPQGASNPVFCANCFVFLGHSPDEVAEGLGVFSNALSTWTECPRCNKPTLLRL